MQRRRKGTSKGCTVSIYSEFVFFIGLARERIWNNAGITQKIKFRNEEFKNEGGRRRFVTFPPFTENE
jgi:hypothetical protein